MKFAPLRLLAVALAIFGADATSAPAATSSFVALPASVPATTDVATGYFATPSMSVEVVLAPRNGAQLSAMLANLPNALARKQWLATGQFDALFAPSSAQVAAVAAYLRAGGLNVTQSSSPFFVRATGSSGAVAAAFKTSLVNYRNPQGATYFANALPVQLPSSVASGVIGVVGLSNTLRAHPQYRLPLTAPAPAVAGCEAPYPTRAQLFAAVNKGTPFAFGYGAGPGCSGLTPSQDNSLYGAMPAGARGHGEGVTLAVFELSAYLRSDIATWTAQFYGSSYAPPLADIIVDGGPLKPACPSGDTCPPKYNGYSGDIEVDADIETQLAIAPQAHSLLVYEAPDDYTGQTSLDDYVRIANDNKADSISSSWGICENDAGAAYAQAENLIFEQMALQGQSMFSAAGDTGAYDCIRSDNTTVVNVDDPPSQPWVTSVGGTSFESDNPGLYPTPAYPAGIETVWNVDNLCNAKASEGGQPGFFWCAETGAGGGGNSQFWGRPYYQYGRGVFSPYTAYGNGSTQCVLGPVGRACRQVPDVSANADEYTPYAEYCTGSSATPHSVCATFSGAQTPPGWFGIGGTSLSSPLWSAVIADRDSYQRGRSGSANVLLYTLYNADASEYFNDITGIAQATDNNGLFPARPGFDDATGLGSPRIAQIVSGS